MPVLAENPALRKWNLRTLRKNAVEQRKFAPREAAGARSIRRFAHSGVRDEWIIGHPRRGEAMQRALAQERGEVLGSWSGDIEVVGAWQADADMPDLEVLPDADMPGLEALPVLEDGEIPDSD